jgi:hypothetical protein
MERLDKDTCDIASRTDTTSMLLRFLPMKRDASREQVRARTLSCAALLPNGVVFATIHPSIHPSMHPAEASSSFCLLYLRRRRRRRRRRLIARGRSVLVVAEEQREQ